MLLVAAALGIGSAVWVAEQGINGSVVSIGPWQTQLASGSERADPYTRAAVSLNGLFALTPDESLYFTASTDSDGKPLMVDCTYKLMGRDLPARWWSITAYGPDNYLIPNSQERYSVARSSLLREADGSFIISVSPDASSGNWIPTGMPADSKTFILMIRLYNPEKALIKNPQNAELPAITLESCS